MSIITKEKTTANYFVRLENIPESTRKNKKNAVIKFQEFCKKHHNATTDEICKELLLIKKQDEQKYTDTLYYILRLKKNFRHGYAQKSTFMINFTDDNLIFL